jgi:hypothetical protein
LFGNLLLGTLNKFRNEQKNATTGVSAQQKKLMEIDQRLEKTKEEDRERIYREKQEQFSKRHDEELEIKRQRRLKAIELGVSYSHYCSVCKFTHFRPKRSKTTSDVSKSLSRPKLSHLCSFCLQSIRLKPKSCCNNHQRVLRVTLLSVLSH